MKSERNFSSGADRIGVMVLAAFAAVLLFSAGCCCPSSFESGYADHGKTQIQFHTPPGATVEVFTCSPRSHQIPQYGPYGHRLEHAPEQFCVFNLSPGMYEFKYTSAEGLPGVSVYGELEVHGSYKHEARVFMRRSFIPIALPSEYYQKVEAIGDEIFPYRSEAMRTAIDELDLQRLKQGDVVEKVFFVADLKKAEELRNKLEQEIAVTEREIEYADARFRNAYIDFKIDMDTGYIHWEKERRKLDQKLTALQDEYKRVRALLKGDHVLTRRGMMALATQEIVQSHRDVVKASQELGEVLVVMRLGGRHMHMGNPRHELAVNPE